MLFIISVLEGLPIIGPLIPGHTAVILAGFLSKIGVFNIYIVSLIVIIGAGLGDIIGFMIGRRFGFAFLYRFGKFFLIKEEYIDKAKNIVNEHSGKAIILGRFNPLTRPLAPFAVGASGVRMRSFWFYDLVGVVIWAIGSLFIGYLFGASYYIVADYIGKFIALFFIIGILMIWGYGFINRQFHIFAKYELIVLILNVFGLYILFKSIQDIISSKSFMVELDVWVNLFFSAHVTVLWQELMIIITNLFSPYNLAILSLFGIIYLLYKRYWRYSIISILSLGGGYFITVFLKNIIMRVRPEDALIYVGGYSFPSGHAVAVTIFFSAIIYFFARKFKSLILREIFIVFCVFMIILVSLSRVYLGVHWLSDVVAGVGFGLFWTTLMILLIRYVGIIVVKFKENLHLD